jgi:hypothetical protein
MNIYHYQNDPPFTPLSPSWDCVLAECNIKGIDFPSLAAFILSHEDEIHNLMLISPMESQDRFDGSGPNSLTSWYPLMNFFSMSHPEILKLRLCVFEAYCEFLSRLNIPRRKVWMQVWPHIVGKDDFIGLHVHNVSSYSYLSAHITIQGQDTSTIYLNPINARKKSVIHECQNSVGKLSLFQQHIPHFTTPNQSTEPRISVGIDFLIDEDYQRYLPDSPRKAFALLFDAD